MEVDGFVFSVEATRIPTIVNVTEIQSGTKAQFIKEGDIWRIRAAPADINPDGELGAIVGAACMRLIERALP